MSNKLKKNIFILIFPIVILSGCYDNYVSSIPNYRVSLQLNLTSTYPTFKNNPNQFLIFETPPKYGESVGFGGIIIYAGVNPDEYFAFDLACPYEATKTIKVVPSDYFGRVICETCGSVYEISSSGAFPIEGPSKEPLKQYKASLQGDWLHIFN
jgi:nitrite reductase/ring-hydroxylating ferredoxin subunit